MTPNFLKSNVGGGAGHIPSANTSPAENSSSSSSNNTDSILPSLTNKMDGDHSAKSMEQGANSATKGAQDMTDGLHEGVKQTPAEGDKMTGHGTSIFSKEGAIGKQFTPEGAIGGTAQSIGGPLDKQGFVGKHFGADGSIGGAAQKLAENNEKH